MKDNHSKDNHSKGTWVRKYLTICRGRDYIAQVLCLKPTNEDFDNARLITAASGSYNKNCGDRAVECAEQDLLGECLGAMQEFVDRVERGEVRSRYTYNKFQAILAKRKEEMASEKE